MIEKKHEKSKSKIDKKIGIMESKREEKSKLNKDQKHEFGKGKVDSFDKLVKENKASGKSWYNGFEGKWWWGMTEEKVRARLIEIEQILGKIKPETSNDVNKEIKPEISNDINKEIKPEISNDINKEIKPEISNDINKEIKPETILEPQTVVDIEQEIGIKVPELIKDIVENGDLEKFDQLIKNNKDSGKNWYNGLDGKWWWGMSEEEARVEIYGQILDKSDKANDRCEIISGKTNDSFKKIHNNRRVAIASIIRNEESNGHLKKFFDCCQKLEKFHDIIYIFIEGDSSDNTYRELEDWLSSRDDYILKKLDKKKPRFPKDKSSGRTRYFAELRNMLIDYALSIPDVSEVLMIDANYGWKGDLVSSLRDIDADIAAPLVVMNKNNNGKFLFYDTWAFRKNGSQFSHYYPYVGYSKLNKPISVDSVGGGYLINRKVLESNVKYNGDRDCEHVGFCQKARKKGFSIKINPNVFIMKGGLRHNGAIDHAQQ
jgi:hypothetical protein